MDKGLSAWIDRNNIISVNIKKGNEVYFKSDEKSTEDLKDSLEHIIESMPGGSYKILGRDKAAIAWDNAQSYPFVKNNSPSAPTMLSHQAHSAVLLTPEQVQEKIEHERKKWEFELLLEKFNEVKVRVERLEEKFKNMADAVKALHDEDDSNDKSGIEKLTEITAAAKSMFSDL